jgi:hypothetical protein
VARLIISVSLHQSYVETSGFHCSSVLDFTIAIYSSVTVLLIRQQRWKFVACSLQTRLQEQRVFHLFFSHSPGWWSALSSLIANIWPSLTVALAGFLPACLACNGNLGELSGASSRIKGSWVAL